MTDAREDLPEDPGRVPLEMLKDRYGHRWSIRGTENLWIATAADPDADHAPTVVQPDAEAFIRELEDPPARAGRRSLLSARWVADRVERIRAGVYIGDDPPTT